jgi:hypothetical protein
MMSPFRTFSSCFVSSLSIAFLTLGPTTARAVEARPLRFVPGPIVRVDTSQTGTQVVGKPLAAEAPGSRKALVVWLQGGADGAGHVIWGRQLDSRARDGFGPQRDLARVPAQTIQDFSVSAGGSYYALGWRTFDPVLRQQELFARVFDLQLNPAGPLIHIALPPLDPDEQRVIPEGPEVGLDDSGRLVAAWIENVDPFGLGRFDLFHVRARRYALDGTPGTDIVGAASDDSRSLVLAEAPDGTFLVAWEGFDGDRQTTVRALLYGPDNVERHLFLQPGEASGSCFHSSRSPALAASAGSFFVAFEDRVGQASFGNGEPVPECRGVFTQIYDLAGQNLRGELPVQRDSRSPLVQSNRSLFLLTWEGFMTAPSGARRRGTLAHPYFANGSSAGPDASIQSQPVTGLAFGPVDALLVWKDRGVRARFLRAR